VPRNAGAPLRIGNIAIVCKSSKGAWEAAGAASACAEMAVCKPPYPWYHGDSVEFMLVEVLGIERDAVVLRVVPWALEGNVQRFGQEACLAFLGDVPPFFAHVKYDVRKVVWSARRVRPAYAAELRKLASHVPGGMELMVSEQRPSYEGATDETEAQVVEVQSIVHAILGCVQEDHAEPAAYILKTRTERGVAGFLDPEGPYFETFDPDLLTPMARKELHVDSEEQMDALRLAARAVRGRVRGGTCSEEDFVVRAQVVAAEEHADDPERVLRAEGAARAAIRMLRKALFVGGDPPCMRWV